MCGAAERTVSPIVFASSLTIIVSPSGALSASSGKITEERSMVSAKLRCWQVNAGWRVFVEKEKEEKEEEEVIKEEEKEGKEDEDEGEDDEEGEEEGDDDDDEDDESSPEGEDEEESKEECGAKASEVVTVERPSIDRSSAARASCLDSSEILAVVKNGTALSA